MKWKNKIIAPCGVVIGADTQQEWLIPWWYNKYRETNDYPVMLADFGLFNSTRIMWTKTKNTVVDIPGEYTNNWFKKPLAILAAPFEKIIWLDLDCEVKQSLTSIFNIIEDKIYGTEDKHYHWLNGKVNHTIINGGMVGVKHGNPIIEEWAKVNTYNSNSVYSDTDTLNILLNKQVDILHVLPSEYHWLRLDGDNPNAVIMHWTGPIGKQHIREQMNL